MLNSNFYRMVSRQFFCQRCFFAALALLLFAETAWTQTMTRADEVLRDRIGVTRKEIDTAASWHATNDQLGALWLRLGNAYEDEFDIQRSEEAFNHALKLLRNSSTQKYYARTLDDLGSLYLVNNRWKESENCRGKALAIYEGLGDLAGVARVRVGLSIALMQEHRFAESDDQSAKALKILQEQKNPDKADMVAGLIASSYAKCFQGRCDEGLALASQAMTLARAAFSETSFEVVAGLVALGFEEWKTGDEAEGDKAMREGMELMRRQENTIPHALQVDAQLKFLTSYTNYLKGTHQKVMAKQIENEIARLKGEQPPSCKDCTVNAVALSMNKRQE